MFRNRFILPLFGLMILVGSNFSLSAQSFQNAYVAKYRGDKSCAISYTFDDGLKEHYTLVFPKLESLGFKGTFWINGNTTSIAEIQGGYNNWPRATWVELKIMADSGHEISNHGWSHKNLTKLTEVDAIEEIERNDSIIEAMTGVRPVSYCYAGNRKNEEVIRLASKNRVGTRVNQFSIGKKATYEKLKARIQTLLENRDWGVAMTHGITYGYDAFTSDTVFWNHLEKVKSMEDSVWVGTFREVASYTTLRKDLRLVVRTEKNHTIIRPISSLDPKLYVAPLTLVIPGVSENSVSVRQNKRLLPVEYKSGKALVDFDPHGGEIALTKLVVLPKNRDKVWVFLLAGQSNMAGRGKVEAVDTISTPRVLTINRWGEVVCAREPLHFYEPRMMGTGSGVAFGKELIKHIPNDVVVLLLPTAIGGSSIDQWIQNSTHRGVPLLTNFTEKASFGMRVGKIMGILWHQGESDLTKAGNDHYLNQLKVLVDKFRLITVNPTLPVVVGEVGEFHKNASGRKSLNRQLRSFSVQDRSVKLVKTGGLRHKGDFLHFDAESQRELGKRYAKAWLNIHRQFSKNASSDMVSQTSQRKITVYGIGDSTMANKRNPETNKERGWGMVFQQFFDSTRVKVDNRALNGRSTKSFIKEKRWQVIVDSLHAGDYVLIQFGHNDQKADKPEIYADVDSAYRENLTRFVNETRAKGAFPVLLTSVVRRHFDENGVLLQTHGKYPDAVRQLARELYVPLIDMEKESRKLIQAMGDEPSKRLFMISTGKDDNTHFVEEGAVLMAGIVARAICENKLPLCEFVVKK